MSRARVLMVLALLAALAAVALWDAVQASFDVELEIVRLEVNGIRQALLAREAQRVGPPIPCGSEAAARAAIGKSPPENLGQCGLQVFGREASQDGPYYVTVAPGAVDFTVVGFARRGEQILELRANRSERAQVVEPKEEE